MPSRPMRCAIRKNSRATIGSAGESRRVMVQVLVRRINGRKIRFYDYKARAIPNGPHDGTLAPWAVAGLLPFAPECSPVAQTDQHRYPEMTSKYRFKCSYNPTFASSNKKGWVSEGYNGLDQGPIVMMIENYRPGLIWRLMRKCPYIITGLRRAGFQAAGWVNDFAVNLSIRS